MILRLYCCLFYELILQIALWFVVTFFVLFLFNIEPNLLKFILWGTSGFYFVYSWSHGGQTLAMKAWKLKLISPSNGLWFYFKRYLLATFGFIFLLISFLWAIFNNKNQYLHDFILGSKIIDVRIWILGISQLIKIQLSVLGSS